MQALQAYAAKHAGKADVRAAVMPQPPKKDVVTLWVFINNNSLGVDGPVACVLADRVKALAHDHPAHADFILGINENDVRVSETAPCAAKLISGVDADQRLYNSLKPPTAGDPQVYIMFNGRSVWVGLSQAVDYLNQLYAQAGWGAH